MDGFNNRKDYEGPYYISRITHEAINAKRITKNDLIIDEDGMANGPKAVMEKYEEERITAMGENDWRKVSHERFTQIENLIKSLATEMKNVQETFLTRVDDVDRRVKFHENTLKAPLTRSTSVSSDRRETRATKKRNSMGESGSQPTVSNLIDAIENAGNSGQIQAGQSAASKSIPNREPQEEEEPIHYEVWCNYEKRWTDHDARRCPRKKGKPNGCWKCKRMGHMKRDCPNEEVEGAGWGPEGPPQGRSASSQKNNSNYQTTRQIFRRANNGPAPESLPKMCNENDSDATKLMAKELLEATKSDKHPEGYEKIAQTYVRVKQWEEEDLVIREKAKKKEFLRVARIENVNKEECRRMIRVVGISDETKKTLAPISEVKKGKGMALFKATAELINRDILKDSKMAIDGTEEIAHVEVIAADSKKITTTGDDGKEIITLEPVWELKVEFLSKTYVTKVLHRFIYRKDLGIPYEFKYKYLEVLTDQEQENDDYVKREVKARNAKLIEKGQTPDWKYKGKSGVLELTRGLWEEQAKEQSQKRGRGEDWTPEKPPPSQKSKKDNGDENMNKIDGISNAQGPQVEIETEEMMGHNNNG